MQRRATKLIPSISTFSYEARLNHLQLHSLNCRRQRSNCNLIEAYKIINNLYQLNPGKIFTKLDKIFTKLSGNSTRGHTLRLFKPRVITALRQHFFNIRVINHWNNLPQDVATAKSISAFKSKMDHHWYTTRYGHNQRPMAYLL